MKISVIVKPSIQNRYYERGTKRPAASYWRNLIIEGTGLDRYGGDRSSAAMASALGYVNAGASFAEYCAAMTDSTAALDWAQRRRNGKPRPASDTTKRLRDTWRKAEDRLRSRPAVADKSSARWEISLARNRANLTPWGGQRGTTDRLVIGAMHELANRLGSLTVSAACRNVAEDAGVSHMAAARSLARLSADGVWLRLEDAGSREHSATYRVLLPADDSPTVTAEPETRIDGMPQPHELARHDAFAWQGLGRSAARILATLGDEGRTVADLANLTGLHPKTVARHLRGLADYDLAAFSPIAGTWARVEHANAAEHLAAIADCLGTTGTADRRHLAHERQREGWAMYVELRGTDWAQRQRLTPEAKQRMRERTAVTAARMAA